MVEPLVASSRKCTNGRGCGLHGGADGAFAVCACACACACACLILGVRPVGASTRRAATAAASGVVVAAVVVDSAGLDPRPPRLRLRERDASGLSSKLPKLPMLPMLPTLPQPLSVRLSWGNDTAVAGVAPFSGPPPCASPGKAAGGAGAK